MPDQATHPVDAFKVHIQERREFRGATTIHLIASHSPNPIAHFAQQLMERMALAAGKDGGEDSVGRAKIVLQTPAEVVDRACEIALLAYNAFFQRGWMVECPIPKAGRAYPEELETALEDLKGLTEQQDCGDWREDRGRPATSR